MDHRSNSPLLHFLAKTFLGHPLISIRRSIEIESVPNKQRYCTMRFFNSMLAAAEHALMPSSSEIKSPKFGFDLRRINSNDANNEQGDLIVPGPFLRDFDENPTDLYRFIQMKRWNRVMEVIEKSPAEAKVWIFRTEEDNVRLRWRLLPLHAALIVSFSRIPKYQFRKVTLLTYYYIFSIVESSMHQTK